jgi:hypothetical protein
MSLALQPPAVRVGDAVGQLLLSDQERASGMRVAINLEPLVRGFGLELSEALSRYVLGGIMSRSEARRVIGLPGRADTDAMLQPVNVETVDQAQARNDRADAATAAATTTAANSNVAAAGLVDELKRLRAHGLDIGGGLEGSSVVVRLPTGQEVQVDLADICRALRRKPATLLSLVLTRPLRRPSDAPGPAAVRGEPHAACWAWAAPAVFDGVLSSESIKNAAPPTCTLLPGDMPG